MLVQPYLTFDGRCDEALAFYRRALGAEVVALKRYSEMPEPQGCEGMPALPPDKVMHSALRIGDTVVFASDGMCGGKPTFEGISLSLTAASDAEAARFFDALGDGGKVQMPLGPSFFASSFGMVSDRFGVSWMVLSGIKNA